MPVMWKRDVSKAFRRVPIRSEHLPWAFVVYLWRGIVMASGHVGMPFGSTSAVVSWHRMGELVAWFTRFWFRVVLGRYVDDFFGAHRPGLRWRCGLLLDVVLKFIGLPGDPKKAEDDKNPLVVLGVQLAWTQEEIQVTVPEQKVVKWTAILDEAAEKTRMDTGVAAKMAGRLSFACHAAGGRQGRAYIAPFYSQQHDPLPGGRASPLLVLAALWWSEYLRAGPRARVLVRRGGLPWRVAYTDAAGTGLCCAMIYVQGIKDARLC